MRFFFFSFFLGRLPKSQGVGGPVLLFNLLSPSEPATVRKMILYGKKERWDVVIKINKDKIKTKKIYGA